MSRNTDPLLQYVVGLDAANFDLINTVISQAEQDESLYDAIQALHSRFDSNESFTEQLRRTRNEYQGQGA